ncbi:TOPRIM nucleotidyl transferase/hydrolase domain-containing protein [Marinitoga sp. 38H-ov]|uniref:TOPRIM nucleotidyl transferase/hydrolase domain-containing protein n=1 Tax=Marinitoga sp. 38H-ov TaxID=1755814 RepID=UPI003217F011
MSFFIKTFEEKYKDDFNKNPQKRLSNQYISIVEIGRAYMHKFKGLLEFLNLKTLIITDINSININREKC